MTVFLAYVLGLTLTSATPIELRAPANLTPLSTCPVGNNGTIIANNLGYNLCSFSQYNVPSLSWPVVANDSACASLCAQTSGCTVAVFDRAGGNCNIKGSPSSNALNFVYDSRFDAILLAYTPVQKAPITSCPFGGYSYTGSDGTVYDICPMSDYPFWNSSVQVLPNVFSATSCASLCLTTNNCAQAVYDNVNNYCHLKPNLGPNPEWNVNTQFDSIRVRSPGVPSTTTPISTSLTSTALPTATGVDGTAILTATCPYGGQNYTSKNGITYNICPYTNYNCGNLAVVSAQDVNTCAEICSTTPGCYNVVYAPGQCSLKGAPYEPNWQYSNYYTTIALVNTTANNQAMAPMNGLWSVVIPLQVNPVAAYIVPAFPIVQKFLSFASWSATTFGGGDYYNTIFGSFDLGSNAQGEFNVANTQHNMFCPGMNALADGRLVIDGGDTDDAVTVYDPFANTFTRVANMTMGRGYQSSVTLSDGRAFTIGGSFTGGIGGQDGVPMKNGEVYNPKSNQWTALPGAQVQPMLTTYDNAGAWRTDNHAWLFAWSGGSVFQAGPSKNMNWYGTSGTGSVTGAGQRNSNNDQMCGVSVMYDNGKIFSAGGAQSYTNTDALSVAHQIVLNGVNKAPSVSQLPNMNYPRSFANAIVLPNGKVFITGGQQYAQVFTDTQSVLQAEIWDPVSNTFSAVAPASVPRNYHSTALLLPDGRVMSGGGGLCYVNGGCDNANHDDLQFYSPPYLFDSKGNAAVRPQVSSITSSQQSGQRAQVKPGGTLTIKLSSTGGISHVLVRIGSATHSINTDQRRIPLTVKSTSGNTVVLAVPNDNGIVPAGYWYYFAVASSGVHSIGLTVNVLSS